MQDFQKKYFQDLHLGSNNDSDSLELLDEESQRAQNHYWR